MATMQKHCPACGDTTQPSIHTDGGNWLLPCGSEVASDGGPMQMVKQSDFCQIRQLRQQLAAAPAWHSRPTVPGLWFGKDRDRTVGVRWGADSLADDSYHMVIESYRWYGPIPIDTPTLPPTLQPSADDGAPPDDAEKGD